MTNQAQQVDPLLYYLITRDPAFAAHAEACGADRIMVDLEVRGKEERQGLLDTIISAHGLDDVAVVRRALSHSELVTRVNPLWEGTRDEVDGALENGTDRFMLPMFRTPRQLDEFLTIVDGRAPVTGLLETKTALEDVENISSVEGVDDYHIGLTDLHIEYEMSFLFQCLGEGLLDPAAQTFRRKGIPFGFGGIAHIGTGSLPAELLIAEHMRLGSSRVILGRVFRGGAESLEELRAQGLALEVEISRVTRAAMKALARDARQIEADRRRATEIVGEIAEDIERARVTA